MKKELFIVFCVAMGILSNAFAGFVIKNGAEERLAKEMAEYNSITPEEAMVIQTLENDIRILDDEIRKCEKSKKGWTAATVIGSVGTAATGIAAIVQGVQISDKKSELKQVNQEVKDLKKENNVK